MKIAMSKSKSFAATKRKAYKRVKINHKNFGIIAFNWEFWNWSMISGSFQSWLSGQSGTLLFVALCKIRRSRSSWIRFPVPYLSKFCVFNLGRITAKNDVLGRSRALAKRLMFSSSSAAWLSSDFISRWSSLTFILCSGCLSLILHESIFEQGGLRHVVFVWPVAWQLLHTRPRRLESVMYSFSCWLSFCSASFAVTICTCKTVRLPFISCCFESNGLHPCWSFWADVGLACTSSEKLADRKVDAWNGGCLYM